jgi:hypothetical protein
MGRRLRAAGNEQLPDMSQGVRLRVSRQTGAVPGVMRAEAARRRRRRRCDDLREICCQVHLCERTLRSIIWRRSTAAGGRAERTGGRRRHKLIMAAREVSGAASRPATARRTVTQFVATRKSGPPK